MGSLRHLQSGGHGFPEGAKNPPASVGDIRDVVPSLGREDPLEEGRATHSSIPAYEPQGQRRLRATVHRVAARCDLARMRGG